MKLHVRRAIAIAVALLLGGAAAPAADAKKDLPEIQRRGALRVLAVLSDEEPYFISQMPQGGFDWELLQGFANLHKIRLELVPVSGWGGLIPALVKDRGDVIAGGFTDTDARRKQNEYVANVRRTSTWSRLAVKYFGASAPEILKKARGD